MSFLKAFKGIKSMNGCLKAMHLKPVGNDWEIYITHAIWEWETSKWEEAEEQRNHDLQHGNRG